MKPWARLSTTSMGSRSMFELRDLGRMRYGEALDIQRDLVARRKTGEIPDQLLVVEHPHVLTLGRNGHLENVLASEDVLRRAGIEFHHTDRGGDITYHGPAQIVGYPIFDLRELNPNVLAYAPPLDQPLITPLPQS